MFKKVFLVLVAVVSISSHVMSLNALEEAKSNAPATTDTRELSQEERIAALKNILMNRADILSLIPGAGIISDDTGNYVEYNGVKIEELDPVVFDELYKTTFRLVNQKNTENTLRQLKQLERINNYNRSQRTLRQINNLKRKY